MKFSIPKILKVKPVWTIVVIAFFLSVLAGPTAQLLVLIFDIIRGMVLSGLGPEDVTLLCPKNYSCPVSGRFSYLFFIAFHTVFRSFLSLTSYINYVVVFIVLSGSLGIASKYFDLKKRRVFILILSLAIFGSTSLQFLLVSLEKPGRHESYPCGVTDDAYEFERFTFGPNADAMLELLPVYEADPVQLKIDTINVGTPIPKEYRYYRDVDLNDAPNVLNMTREEYTNFISVRAITLRTSSRIANDLARESGVRCTIVPLSQPGF